MLLMLLAAAINTDALLDWLRDHGLAIALIVVAALVALRILGRAIPPAVRRTLLADRGGLAEQDLSKRTDTLTAVLLGGGRIAVLVVAALMVVGELGIDIVPVIAGLGIGGIAIGLGAQSLVRDAINGILILSENQFGKGDMVKVAGVQGWVEEVNLRRTVLRDLDGTLHSVPNSEIKVASNLTRGYSGVDLVVSVAAGQDLDAAIEVVNTAGRALSEDAEAGADVLESPRVTRVESVGAASIELRVSGRATPGSQWQVTSALRRRIVKAFDSQGIRFGAGGAVAPAAPPAAVSTPAPPAQPAPPPRPD